MPQNIDALSSLPRQLGVRAVVAMSPENFTYASGTHIITVSWIRPRYSFVLLLENGAPELIVCSIDTEQAQAESWIDRVVEYTEFVDDPMEVLARRLAANGIESGGAAIDFEYLPKAAFDRLARYLPGIAWQDASAPFALIRAVKTGEEIAELERAVRATHSAVLQAMEQSCSGDTEADMSGRIFKGVIDRGADGVLFLFFSSGDRIGQSHSSATTRVPRPGELIRFDVAARWGPWASDFARTYSAGDPTPLQRENYGKIAEIQEETIEFVRPGISAESVFHFCREAFLKRGLPFHMPHVGHSFGHELHEMPMLRPGETVLLEEGMVLNIEPALSDPAGNFFHLEDLIEVRADGSRILSHGLAPRELPVIGERIGTTRTA